MSYKAFAALKEHVELDVIKKMAPEELNTTLNKLHSRVKELEEELGLTKISLKHKTTLLESCEMALEDRDTRIARQKMGIERVMPILAQIEPSIDDWNYPIGMKDEVKELCDLYFGEGIRPEDE